MAVIVTILVGFVMMTLGSALLLLGEVPFIAGKRISATRSRLIGAVLFSFMPLAFAMGALCNLIFGAGEVEGPVVTSFVFSFCCLAIFVILFRVLIPKRPPRKTTAKAGLKKESTFDPASPVLKEAPAWMEPEAEPPPPSKTAPPKKGRKPAADSNPFDFG
ncbi:MAG: hypothetical protein HY289_13050 [Planctomycetes bacterium]|nr:hypothetical protein [Planctomycetota bacterium]